MISKISKESGAKQMTEEFIELNWPSSKRIFLTLDYECDYGTALERNTFQSLDYTNKLIEILEDLEIPLTCFIQTEVLEEKPGEVERLRQSDVPVSFHPHSHTHSARDEADVRDEVRHSTQAFRDFFGDEPVGYRFPNGNVETEDYQSLSIYDYEFDASIFPSWRPGHFNNRDASLTPLYYREQDIYEIPFTVYSESFRIPTTLSYCRLFGRLFTSLLSRRPPSVLIFNIHMHDLVNPNSYEQLSPFYRTVYARNSNGFCRFRSLMEEFVERSYTFGQLDEVYEALDRSDADHSTYPVSESRSSTSSLSSS